MTVTDFEFICQILRERSGLVLTNDKAYLLESRLLPVARKWKLATFDDLVRVIRTKMDESVVRDVVEAMTTNESFSGEPVMADAAGMQSLLDSSLVAWLGHLKETAENPSLGR